ncbi:I/LWEQ domain [Trinorchestia longiramus]|nr:I/LWEQ domain [Trinorchestia longiramus]
MGRCRLSPLIPCVQDSTSLYDLTVRIMFNLHKVPLHLISSSALTTDLLIGHRNRFNEQFQELRSFYSSTSKLQYFQQLGITIPQLPAEPPNFLVEAELAVHVAPVVVLQPEEPDDASEAFEASLIDTAEPPPIPPHPVDQSLNGSFAESLAERDSIIDALTQELEKTRILLQQHQQQQQQLRATIAELQASNARLENSVRSSEQATKESLMAQAEVAAAGAEAIAKLQYEENNRKIAEDKFTKLREIYQKIRDEHVALIRSKAEVDKLVDSERSARDASESAVKRLEARQVEQDALIRDLHDNTDKKAEVDKLVDSERSARDASESAVKRLEARQAEQDALIRDLHDNTDKEKETLMNRVTELQLSLDAAREHTDKQLQEQEERYASLESQHKELQEDLQKVEMQLNETEGAKNVSQKEADGLKEELEKARKEMNATKQALSESEARSAGLVDEKIQLQETLHGVQMERDKLDEIRKCFLKEVKDHEENGLEMEVRIAELVREKENLVESQDKLRTKKDDLVKELKEAEREKMSLVNKQVELYDKVGSLSSELASSLATVTSLQQQRSDLVAKAAQLGNRIEQLEEALAVGQRSLEAMQEEVEDREERLATLQQDLQECMQQREDLQECKNQLLAMVADLQDRLAASVADRRAMKKDHKKQVAAQQRCTEERVVACVVACVAGCLELVTTTRQHARCDQHAELRSTPEFTLLFEPIISRCLEKLPAIVSRYFSAGESVAAAPGLISELAEFSHSTANFVLYATAASHVAADIEKAQELVGVLDKLADRSCSLLTAVQQRTPVDHHFTALTELLQQSCRLVSRCVDTSVCPEDAADLVEQEMAAMTRAISEASATTAAMLEQARKQQTGLKLEVNESMLGVCMELLSAVQVLVVRAAQLQQEVVQKGRGGASPKDFYKRNHRWTQGLISGAKSVAIACQALMAAADAVVCKGGRFEEVIVSSREIAASSMQLVMASRVKADADSTALSNVNSAAKNISTLTGTLVATAENCRDRVASGHKQDEASHCQLHPAYWLKPYLFDITRYLMNSVKLQAIWLKPRLFGHNTSQPAEDSSAWPHHKPAG